MTENEKAKQRICSILNRTSMPAATATADASDGTNTAGTASTVTSSGCGAGSQAHRSCESESELGRFMALAEAMALPSSEHGLVNSLYAPPLYHILNSIESASGGKTTAAAVQFKG